MQLTNSTAYESYPIWSPNGKQIAFASKRHGNYDVFIMSSMGGEAKRLTTNSYHEIPSSFTPSGDAILFTSSRISLASNRMFPASYYLKTYKVSLKGGREQLVTEAPSENGFLSQDSSLFLYNDIKGQENKWRKHHVSSVTRDLMLHDRAKGSFTPLTTNIGEDRNPVFSADEKTIYFLSEPEGKTFNVYSMPVAQPQQLTQLTQFDKHPVRFLSLAKDNTLCFGYHGEIYTQKAGEQAKKLTVRIADDKAQDMVKRLSLQGDISSVDVSADGSQVAFITHGELFVTSVEFGLTKQISQTVEAENGVSFSPDGRSLVYGSDRSGKWDIYIATLPRKADLNFASATVIEEKALLKPIEGERMMPTFSPNGKEIAFIKDRNILMAYNIASQKVRMVCDKDYHFIQHPRGFDYQWSPDSKHFVMEYIANGHDPYSDIGIVSAQGGTPANITQSGYENGNPRWALNGTAVIYTTEKYGMRNHASWGSERDIMIAFVNDEAYEKFTLSEKEYKLRQAEKKYWESLKKKEGDDQAKPTEDKDKEKEVAKKPVPSIKMELEHLEDRVVRLTHSSASIRDIMMSKDGSKLYFVMNGSLYEMDVRTRALKSLYSKTSGHLLMDAKGEKLFIVQGNSIQKIELKGGEKKSITHSASMQWDAAAERRYMFKTIVNEELNRFYDVNMHGVDWLNLAKEYEPLLKDINNNEDFAECLSEMLGELNVSHTGAMYRPSSSGDDVAELGLFLDESYTGKGLLVDEVIEGGPFDKVDLKVKKGDKILNINGTAVTAAMDYYPLLNHQSHRRLLVTLQNEEGKVWDEVIQPCSKSELNELLYQRWLKWQCAEVDRLSGSRLGYVHIRGMSDEHFRTLYSDVLGKYNKREGIVIDTRNNGGGRLHEDVEVMFSGTKYLTQVIRGREACDMPSRRWNKPSIMLTNEANYSNAHGTPWVYQKMKLGKVVGMPVPGTMTSVNWERMQDKSITFGIPAIGYRTADGRYLENTQVEPDIKVRNRPETILNNRDEQLETAVKELLKPQP